MSQRYALCLCGTTSEVELDATTATCPVCGGEMTTTCPHCFSPLETNGQFCRRCGEEVLEGAFRRETNFVSSAFNRLYSDSR